MTCQCKEHGFCPRRNAYVPRPLWRQCQQGLCENVDRAVDAIERRKERTQRQQEKLARTEKLKARIEKRREKTSRLKGWITLFSTKEEEGMGDTVLRLKNLAKDKGKKDLTDQLRGLLDGCSCAEKNAVKRLNSEHPYTVHQ